IIFFVFYIAPYIHVCGLRNPKVQECYMNSIIALREKLSEGIPELNVPPTKALVFNNISFINQTDLYINSKKVIIYGVENFMVKEFNIDLKNQRLYTIFEYNFLKLDAECDFNIKILIPINGKEQIIVTTFKRQFIGVRGWYRLMLNICKKKKKKGKEKKRKIRINKKRNYFADNVTLTINLHFEIMKKDDKKFIYFDSLNAKINIADLDTNIKKTAANKNSVIGIAINAILGTNKADIIRVIVPNIEKGISDNLFNIANNIVRNFEYDELFPDQE
ncbi:PREDICTED: uncharacterized protein LOC106788705, partial [Polistes canadensis]|uniref:uncharacterized protein LOC106788705 n=1 Tax=Polistes canadensis TaxID=91411 RepID=UPI000718AE2A